MKLLESFTGKQPDGMQWIHQFGKFLIPHFIVIVVIEGNSALLLFLHHLTTPQDV